MGIEPFTASNGDCLPGYRAFNGHVFTAADCRIYNDHNRRVECARILRAVADLLEHGSQDGAGVYDLNGNRVGTWSISELDED